MIIGRKHFTILKYFFISLCFFPPVIVALWPELNVVDIILNLLLAICIIITLIKLLANRKIFFSFFEITLVIFLFWMNIQNVFRNINIYPFIVQSLPVMTYILIMDQSKESFSEYLIGTKAYCVLITTSNLISQLFLPDGIYYNPVESWQPYYVCGNANYFIFFYVFAFGIFLLEDYHRNNCITFSSILYTMSLLISMLIGGARRSTNGIAVILICFVGCLLLIGNWSKKILKHWKIVIIVLLCISIWIFAFDGWKLISDFVFKMTGEDSSFLERGYIWDNAIANIKKHPIIGWGTTDGNLSVGYGGLKRSAHNNYLQISLFGGIPSLIIYFILIISSFKSLRKGSIKSSYVAYLAILAYLVAYIFEQNPFYIGFYAMLMMVNILSTSKRNSDIT